MKQTGFITIIIFLLVVMSCKKESEMYSFFRQTHPKNLKTLADGEFYSWAATDSSIIRADYFLYIQGEITSYGDSIIAYGHCWSEDNVNPSIGHGFDTIIPLSIFPGNTSTFVSYLPELEANTQYYVRSVAIFGNASGAAVDTGYNPVVSQISTLPAIDEWFEQEGNTRPTGKRFDALSFNMGDTIFFGAGNKGENFLLTDIKMYNPNDLVWETDQNFIDLRPPELMPTKAAMTDGIGFALTYKPESAPEAVTAIFIGLGEHDFGEKSGVLTRYLLDENGRWDGSFNDSYPYHGGKISGTVCFTIGSLAYIGTGSHSSAVETWYSYNPAKDFQGDDSHEAWFQMLNVPTTKRTGAIAFAVEGRGYFGLGKDDGGNFLNDFWKFTPDGKGAGSWEAVESFPGDPRQNAVAFVVGSQGYVGTGDNIVGDMEGVITDGGIFSDVWRYDPFNDKWRQIADYTTAKPNYDNPKGVTRACGFSASTIDIGYVGFGIVPDDPDSRAQSDYWRYQPWQSNK